MFKMAGIIWLFAVATMSVVDGGPVLYVEPEQVHLSYGALPTQMLVTWTTFDPTNDSVVEFGEDGLDRQATGQSTKFYDGGSERRLIYIHRVLLEDLTPGAFYVYHCGSRMGWSATFWFRAKNASARWSPRLAVFGDMGNVNAQSLPFLQEEAQKGTIHAALHVGDFAYNMDSDNARVGDEFMRQIEPVAAYVPYMTCVGNHENAYNFSNYVNRFSMVDHTGRVNNHFFSFDIGPAHIISLSTEFYFFVEYGFLQIKNQYEWLEQDLKVRKGIPLVHLYGLEDLFYKYGVDLEFWAHEHSYERLWPVYNRQVYNGSAEKPYTNPRAPVHIITGSAGCQEKLDPFVRNPADWSAARFSDYGYTVMTLHNGTHLSLQQFSVENGLQLLDEITIVKENHGAYPTFHRGTTE
ncbi:acid phosphatase type 7 isoform X2 [Dermacentor variabilis]|uniref:acid phosphatase type 7 isoform X2 n=1 Tax=Dermacentor variabilis TaxID=34621 RepID=UPI003F5AE3C7